MLQLAIVVEQSDRIVTHLFYFFFQFYCLFSFMQKNFNTKMSKILMKTWMFFFLVCLFFCFVLVCAPAVVMAVKHVIEPKKIDVIN